MQVQGVPERERRDVRALELVTQVVERKEVREYAGVDHQTLLLQRQAQLLAVVGVNKQRQVVFIRKHADLAHLADP